jgi:hypothetical protein
MLRSCVHYLSCNLAQCKMLTFMNWFFNYNQQDATIFYYLILKGSTCFGRFLRQSSAALYCTLSFRYCQPILLQAGMVDEMELWMVSWMRWNCGWYRGRDGTVAGIVADMELWMVSWPRWNCGWYRGWDGTVDGIVDTMELTFHLSHHTSLQEYWLTIPEAESTVMCSWWWAEEPPETCRAF